MRHYPAFLDIKNRPCLVVGGGSAAVAKTRLLRRAGAEVTVVAPTFDPELCALGLKNQVTLVPRPFIKGDATGRVLIHAASGIARVDKAVAQAAQDNNIPVNVVDRSELSSFVMPAIVDRGTIVVGISSGGASPVLARRVRTEIEALLPHGLSRLADFAKSFRSAVRATFDDLETRLRFWERFFDGPLAEAIIAGRQGDARAQMLSLVNGAQLPPAGDTHKITIDLTAPDLLTLRDLRRIARADVIVHDATIGTSVLDHARRDALCVESLQGINLKNRRVEHLIAQAHTQHAVS